MTKQKQIHGSKQHVVPPAPVQESDNRRAIWGLSSSFEPWSDDEDETSPGTPSPNSCTTWVLLRPVTGSWHNWVGRVGVSVACRLGGGAFGPTYVWFAMQRAACTAGGASSLGWVSSVETTGPKAEALQLGHRGP
ncbi:hypothetical protein AVEN_104720-1 [Araneus ventricosus]|uniref:Uncharacterized protein n=1 Tax=Araneus ventricosus TaxID=182803 RepID=A0A4Y2RNY6_ARAVE|nr:hypothetical protein AVEN_265955-1 [Araneus ventricosus]GBN77371.1 hypothetical protein AVEN_144072-1 [Araneus ventricosus]GBN78038.1 hypothetical protein AVEN_48371-1 [Araneus ventricosus]GBN78313.1 hypothetical protein AVEN_104720-1 [Araneus ventricosus]